MKVCYLNYYDPLSIHGGAERMVLREAELMAENGNEVILVTTHSGKELSVVMLKDRNIRTWFVPRFSCISGGSAIQRAVDLVLSLWNPLLTMYIDRILSMERPDIVHIHNYGPMSLGIISVAKRLGSKVIQTFHGYNFECPKGSLYKRSKEVCNSPLPICKIHTQICKGLIARSDAIIAVSSYVKKRLLRAGYRSDVISIVPNTSNEVSEKINAKLVGKEILFVGRMVMLKGVHILIEALAKVRTVHSEKFAINFVGDGEHKSYFETLARSAGVDINFLGKISDRDLEKHYQNAYLVIVPSLFPELFAIVILEAMFHGKPVIASNIGGMTELVSHGQTGFLFEPGDVDALTEHIDALLADEELALGMGERALKASKRFSEGRHLKLLLDLYEKVLLKHSP